jgi:septum formation protein
VIPSDVAEVREPGPYPETVARLALRKAGAVAARLREGIVLGADTIVVIDGECLGKPADADEARAALRKLRGRDHLVITGVGVVEAPHGRAAATAVTSRVLMASYSDATIEAYVGSGAPLDKAGGYAIQDLGGELVAGVIGSYTNVIGLPLDETGRLLTAFGVPVTPRSPA